MAVRRGNSGSHLMLMGRLLVSFDRERHGFSKERKF